MRPQERLLLGRELEGEGLRGPGGEEVGKGPPRSLSWAPPRTPCCGSQPLAQHEHLPWAQGQVGSDPDCGLGSDALGGPLSAPHLRPWPRGPHDYWRGDPGM